MANKYSGLFLKPKNQKLAKQISIKTPSEFRRSIKKIEKSGVTTEEFRALNLAKTRAKLQTYRKNLSAKERQQMLEISRTKLPKITKAK